MEVPLYMKQLYIRPISILFYKPLQICEGFFIFAEKNITTYLYIFLAFIKNILIFNLKYVSFELVLLCKIQKDFCYEKTDITFDYCFFLCNRMR